MGHTEINGPGFVGLESSRSFLLTSNQTSPTELTSWTRLGSVPLLHPYIHHVRSLSISTPLVHMASWHGQLNKIEDCKERSSMTMEPGWNVKVTDQSSLFGRECKISRAFEQARPGLKPFFHHWTLGLVVRLSEINLPYLKSEDIFYS